MPSTPAEAPRSVGADDVWVIIPVFNEDKVIQDVVAEVREVFAHVVCVDDGSSDDSAARIRAAGAHLVSHPVNLGQGAALQTGVEYARTRPGARFFVTFDADGQHQVSDAAAMVTRLRTEPIDILIGTRFSGGGAKSVPWFKRIVLRTIVFLSPHTRKLGLSDTHNGLRAFNKTVADQLDLLMAGMGHASEFITLIGTHGWRVDEEPVTILYTEYSKAKGQSLLNGINIIADGLLMRGRR